MQILDLRIEGRETIHMISVEKRDGQIAEFNLRKISDAITKAFIATEKLYTDEIISLLALRVTSDFQKKIKDNLVHVEDIQDSVENVLEQTGYTDVAKAYILYRKQAFIKGIQPFQIIKFLNNKCFLKVWMIGYPKSLAD